MKIFSTIFYSLFTLLLLGIAGLFLVPLLPIDNNIEIKIVESGSMEPAIMTGSLVVVAPIDNYQVSDVITFKGTSSQIPTTHRIVNIEERGGVKWFTTKGDANEEADTEVTQYSAVIGKVVLAVPYVGFVLDFARQPIGFMLLIVLPALMIVLGEIEKIWKEIRKKKEPVIEKEETAVSSDFDDDHFTKSTLRMMDIASPVRYSLYDASTSTLVIPRFSSASVAKHTRQTHEWATSFVIVLVSIFFASLSFIGSTVSYFNDTESSLQNLLRATALDFNVLADGDTYEFAGTELLDGDGALVTIISPETGSAEAKYTVIAEKMEGHDLFCSSIVASTSVPISYDGPLVGLSATGVSFGAPWTISFRLAPDIVGLVPNEECVIDIVYTAWSSDSETGVGYSDVERVQLEFYAPAGEALKAPSEESLFFNAPEEELGAPQEGEEVETSIVEEEEPEETEEVEEEVSGVEEPQEEVKETEIEEASVIEIV